MQQLRTNSNDSVLVTRPVSSRIKHGNSWLTWRFWQQTSF